MKKIIFSKIHNFSRISFLGGVLLAKLSQSGSGQWYGIVPRGEEPLGWCEFFEMIQNFVNYALWYFAFPVGVILIAYAAYLFMFSFGSEERIKSGKRIFNEVIIGIILAFSAWLIINTIIGVLSGSKFVDVVGHPWNSVICK